MTARLSDRLRPGAEAAPWVCAEVLRLEAQLAQALQALREARQYMGTIDYRSADFDAAVASVDAVLAGSAP